MQGFRIAASSHTMFAAPPCTADDWAPSSS
jgi:hypothetical protein